MAGIPGRPIPQDKRTELLHLKKEDLSVDMISRLFGYTTAPVGADGSKAFNITEPYFVTTDLLALKAGEYINKKDEHTNVGIFLFNKLMIEGNVDMFIPDGFYNKEITKNEFQKIMGYLSSANMEGKLVLDGTANNKLYTFLRDYEFWALRLPAIFSPGYTMKMIKPNPAVVAKRAELLKNPPKTIEDMTKMEDELVKTAKDATEGDPGRTLFDSGSRGSFSNDYKNMSIMVGAVQNPVTGEYDLVESNYIDGIQKKDLAAAGNIIVNSEYPKAIGTARGGYITKQFYAAFQGITLGDRGSDCGTKKGLMITITDGNGAGLIDQYIMDGNKPVLLSVENIASYYGKSVLLRSPMYCISEKVCNKCMGERYYKIGMQSIGLTSTRMSNNLMQKNLKLRHNMKVQLNHVDIKTVLTKNTGG